MMEVPPREALTGAAVVQEIMRAGALDAFRSRTLLGVAGAHTVRVIGAVAVS